LIRLRQGSWSHFRPWHRNLRQLCIRDDGGIGLRSVVRCLDRGDKTDHKVFVLFEDERPVAWALAVWWRRQQEYDIQLYVKRSHRRQGYGRRVFNRAVKWVKEGDCKFTYFPNPDNDEFFKKVTK